MNKAQARIAQVIDHSTAARLGLRAGDCIQRINGKPLRDMIDYQFLIADERVELEILTADGSLRTVAADKDYDDDLGVVFDDVVFDGIRRCANKCIFCFVDQMAPGRRSTLYVKDDDYRLSFLYGNYITLTNLREQDFERIIAERLSPIYISVHCTEPAMHSRLLGLKKPYPLLPNLRRLVDNGIEIHGQLVLVPGYNDGELLAQTLEDMAALGENVLSLALVPVGLTRYQNPALRLFNREEAAAVIDFAEERQQHFLATRGTRFVFAADELYLTAGRDVPEEESYEDYPQIENGVGLIRLFREDLLQALPDIPVGLSCDRPLVLLSGEAGAQALAPAVAAIRAHTKLDISILTVTNRFFGPSVTVTGLLTGADIVAAIEDAGAENKLFILPAVVLKHNADVLLDDMTVSEMREKSGADIVVVDEDGGSLALFLQSLS